MNGFSLQSEQRPVDLQMICIGRFALRLSGCGGFLTDATTGTVLYLMIYRNTIKIFRLQNKYTCVSAVPVYCIILPHVRGRCDG